MLPGTCKAGWPVARNLRSKLACSPEPAKQVAA